VILDHIKIASPCTANWEAMEGDDRVRFCAECKKNVFNISAMTRSEAEALIREKNGGLCLRLFRRKDGTVLTEDCPTGLRARSRRLALRMTWAISGLLSFATAWGGSEATLTGIVKDATGSVIDHVLVIALNPATGEKVKVHSNAEGKFEIPRLDSDLPYTVSAEAPGFRKFSRESVRAGSRSMAIELQVGTMGGSIQIEAMSVAVPLAPIVSGPGEVVRHKPWWRRVFSL
jgi:hypothetical protein